MATLVISVIDDTKVFDIKSIRKYSNPIRSYSIYECWFECVTRFECIFKLNGWRFVSNAIAMGEMMVIWLSNVGKLIKWNYESINFGNFRQQLTYACICICARDRGDRDRANVFGCERDCELILLGRSFLSWLDIPFLLAQYCVYLSVKNVRILLLLYASYIRTKDIKLDLSHLDFFCCQHMEEYIQTHRSNHVLENSPFVVSFVWRFFRMCFRYDL